MTAILLSTEQEHSLAARCNDANTIVSCLCAAGDTPTCMECFSATCRGNLMPRLTQRQPRLGLLTTGYFSENPSKPEGGSQLVLNTAWTSGVRPRRKIGKKGQILKWTESRSNSHPSTIQLCLFFNGAVCKNHKSVQGLPAQIALNCQFVEQLLGWFLLYLSRVGFRTKRNKVTCKHG